MEDQDQKPLDILGIAPYGEALKMTVEKGFEGAQAVLSRICLPAAGELGLLLQDKIRHWRLNNIIKILNKTEGHIDFENEKLVLTAHPRVVNEIIESGSWCDDDELQDMWAGLIASSCGSQQGDDTNLLFANTLKGLTSRQVKIIKYICENCTIKKDDNDLIFAEHIVLDVEKVEEIVGCNDIHIIDTELDDLRGKELLINENQSFNGHGAGFIYGKDKVVAHLEPSPYAIALYIKCNGFKGSPKEYFDL